jgi:hypothetical protein
MGIRELLGTMLNKLKRKVTLKDKLKPKSFSTMGGKYWKKYMTAAERRVYLEKTRVVIEDNASADYFIGDVDFNNKIIGSTSMYIEHVSAIASEWYLELDKKKRNMGTDPEKRVPLAFDFPDKLKETINVSKSAYQVGELLKNTAVYQDNPQLEDSRRAKRRVGNGNE